MGPFLPQPSSVFLLGLVLTTPYWVRALLNFLLIVWLYRYLILATLRDAAPGDETETQEKHEKGTETEGVCQQQNISTKDGAEKAVAAPLATHPAEVVSAVPFGDGTGFLEAPLKGGPTSDDGCGGPSNPSEARGGRKAGVKGPRKTPLPREARTSRPPSRIPRAKARPPSPARPNVVPPSPKRTQIPRLKLPAPPSSPPSNLRKAAGDTGDKIDMTPRSDVSEELPSTSVMVPPPNGLSFSPPVVPLLPSLERLETSCSETQPVDETTTFAPLLVGHRTSVPIDCDSLTSARMNKPVDDQPSCSSSLSFSLTPDSAPSPPQLPGPPKDVTQGPSDDSMLVSPMRSEMTSESQDEKETPCISSQKFSLTRPPVATGPPQNTLRRAARKEGGVCWESDRRGTEATLQPLTSLSRSPSTRLRLSPLPTTKTKTLRRRSCRGGAVHVRHKVDALTRAENIKRELTEAREGPRDVSPATVSRLCQFGHGDTSYSCVRPPMSDLARLKELVSSFQGRLDRCPPSSPLPSELQPALETSRLDFSNDGDGQHCGWREHAANGENAPCTTSQTSPDIFVSRLSPIVTTESSPLWGASLCPVSPSLSEFALPQAAMRATHVHAVAARDTRGIMDENDLESERNRSKRLAECMFADAGFSRWAEEEGIHSGWCESNRRVMRWRD
ncbi:unnamed protein product [Vitrella brassicaformis CCMP3155]|uniref:Uncharacterized protein n=1 Tax=Vitrella brassicaformis (strain CCMP3155) TaxID=1169540 RepID=A0A0G4GR58_VITBC|nr:unnamed protein product [Vitrella brassicaformis CCMP3155]|eukprot:CEM33015.1 unnamed protein product [Vitrella brassicaformis CCMP3155]